MKTQAIEEVERASPNAPHPIYNKYLYICLVLLRLCLSISPGYIHPDEYFQSGSELFFGCLGGTSTERYIDTSLGHNELGNRPLRMLGGEFTNLTTTWEFEADNAIRSIIPPIVMTLFPLRVYSVIRQWISPNVYMDQYDNETSWNDSLNGWEIWIIPRIFLAILSIFTTDFCIISIVKRIRHPHQFSPIPIEAIVFASSWPTMIFLNRPFSNTLETLCLSLCFFILVKDIERSSNKFYHWMGCICIGSLCSLGFFTRFTFAMFAFPVVFMMLHQHSINKLRKDDKGGSAKRIPGYLLSYAWIFIKSGLLVLSSFISISYIFVQADTNFYNTLHEKWSTDFTYLLTPFNAIRYNSNISNLKDHGLHPRMTHALVNMHMLYGPLAIFFYLGLISRKQECHYKFSAVIYAAYGSVILGLSLLSCAPHQEPRFLLPILVPICILHGRDIMQFRMKRPLIIMWLIFNTALGLFFGGLHQAGVIPSLLAISNMERNRPQAIIFYHTYMPQSFFLRKPNMGQTCAVVDNSFKSCSESQNLLPEYCNSVPIIDLKDSSVELLESRLDESLGCNKLSDKESTFIYLVTPSVSLIPHYVYDGSGHLPLLFDKYIYKEVWNAANIATEEMPEWSGSLIKFVSDMKIGLFQVKCS